MREAANPHLGFPVTRPAMTPASIAPPPLPVEIKWAETLPGAMEWLTTTEDVESKLKAVKAERFRQRFPGWSSPG
jgi:hypothetical protein